MKYTEDGAILIGFGYLGVAIGAALSAISRTWTITGGLALATLFLAYSRWLSHHKQ